MCSTQKCTQKTKCKIHLDPTLPGLERQVAQPAAAAPAPLPLPPPPVRLPHPAEVVGAWLLPDPCTGGLPRVPGPLDVAVDAPPPPRLPLLPLCPPRPLQLPRQERLRAPPAQPQAAAAVPVAGLPYTGRLGVPAHAREVCGWLGGGGGGCYTEVLVEEEARNA